MRNVCCVMHMQVLWLYSSNFRLHFLFCYFFFFCFIFIFYLFSFFLINFIFFKYFSVIHLRLKCVRIFKEKTVFMLLSGTSGNINVLNSCGCFNSDNDVPHMAQRNVSMVAHIRHRRLFPLTLLLAYIQNSCLRYL